MNKLDLITREKLESVLTELAVRKATELNPDLPVDTLNDTLDIIKCDTTYEAVLIEIERAVEDCLTEVLREILEAVINDDIVIDSTGKFVYRVDAMESLRREIREFGENVSSAKRKILEAKLESLENMAEAGVDMSKFKDVVFEVIEGLNE